MSALRHGSIREFTSPKTDTASFDSHKSMHVPAPWSQSGHLSNEIYTVSRGPLGYAARSSSVKFCLILHPFLGFLHFSSPTFLFFLLVLPIKSLLHESPSLELYLGKTQFKADIGNLSSHCSLFWVIIFMFTISSPTYMLKTSKSSY